MGAIAKGDSKAGLRLVVEKCALLGSSGSVWQDASEPEIMSARIAMACPSPADPASGTLAEAAAMADASQSGLTAIQAKRSQSGSRPAKAR
jgi:hypothetical protein